MFKAIGNAAYAAATSTGIAAGTEQPPYPCALPLRALTDPTDTVAIQGLADEIFAATKDLLGNDSNLRRAALEAGAVDPANCRAVWNPAGMEWSPVDYKDPDRDGDFQLMTKKHVGPFNFAKATMTYRGCTPDEIISVMHSDEFETRKRFSADLSVFKILARPTPSTNIQYHEYNAPAPVSSRHLIYLFERRYVPEEDTHYVYGCSIDYPPYDKSIGKNTIRAIALWGWSFCQVGDDTLTCYTSCMNPNGWAPTFIVGWMKGEIGKELTMLRHIICGMKRDGDIKSGKGLQKASGGGDNIIAAVTTNGSSANNNHHSNGHGYDGRMAEDERPQQEEELSWRELEENEELLHF